MSSLEEKLKRISTELPAYRPQGDEPEKSPLSSADDIPPSVREGKEREIKLMLLIM